MRADWYYVEKKSTIKVDITLNHCILYVMVEFVGRELSQKFIDEVRYDKENNERYN